MSRAFPSLTTGALGVALGIGLSHTAYAGIRSRMFRHHAFTEKRVTCATGNILTYYRRDGLPASPTLVFEAGLMSTSTSWLLLADHLDPTLSVVAYDRAGYRKSMRGCAEPYCLSESVDDLRDVIADAVISDGPVYLVGHSLGGYLAYQVATTASRTTESRVPAPAIDGVVLIDPTHPGELMRSRRQREGSRGVHMALKLGPLTSLAGGGLLMDKKNMYAFCAGSPYEKIWRLEGSTVSTWLAARREWRQAYIFMLDGGRQLHGAAVPVTVLAAEETLLPEQEQRSLYDEYVSLGSGGQVVSISETSHMSIVASVTHAAITATELQKIIALWSGNLDSAKGADMGAHGDE